MSALLEVAAVVGAVSLFLIFLVLVDILLALRGLRFEARAEFSRRGQWGDA